MPKFIVNATGDQFFLPDSSQFYFDELPGPKYLRYMPNYDHSQGTDAAVALLVLLRRRAEGHEAAGIQLEGRGGRFDSPQERHGTEGSEALEGVEPEGPRFPPGEDRPGLGRASRSRCKATARSWARSRNPPKALRPSCWKPPTRSSRAPPLKFTTGVKVVPDVYPFKYTQKAPPK